MRSMSDAEGRFELYEREPPTPPEEYVRVGSDILKEFTERLFVASGLPREDSKIVADVLVTADLMGISSHGVQRVGRYVSGLMKCCVNPRPNIRLLRDSGAVALVDADRGLGHPVGVKAMEIAVEKARTFGVSLVLVQNSQHYGIAGYYALKAVEKGLIGVSMTNSEKLVAYVNTTSRVLGTNPIAVGIPRPRPPPILFDAATAVVPVGKIEIYAKLGKAVREGWVLGRDGSLLSGDATRVLSEIKGGRASILPLGGLGEEFGGHKGSGLAFIVDIIAGVLSGAAWGIHVGYTVGDRPANVGHAFAAINIESFMSMQEFYSRLEKYVEEIKSLPKHPSADRIWLPGEKAWRTVQTRLKIGVPIHKNVCRELNQIASEVGVSDRLDCD
ncbi:MAG: Ldh family oxidoreductase [Zestosphaera sp.]